MPSQAFNERFSDFITRFEAGKLNNADLDIQQVGRTVATLGLQVDKTQSDEPLRVERVIPNGAAARGGIQAKDLITTMVLDTDEDGRPLAEPVTIDTREQPLDRLAQKLRGKPKTVVRLTLEREGETEPRKVELTREVVVQDLGFKELDRAAASEAGRRGYEGMTVRLKGQFVPRGGDKEFSLMRVKITCCGADAIPINVVILLDPASPDNVRDFQYMQWIAVEGEVTFQKRRDRNEYVPVVQVANKAEGIKPTEAEPFLQ